MEKNHMKRMLSKLFDYYDYFCRILLLLMSLLVIVFVFMRYLFGITFIWAEEAITLLFISTTFFGVVVGMRTHEHINISILVDLFSPSIRKYIDIFTDLVILGVQVFLVRLSLAWISKVGNVLTKGLHIPIRFVYYMMPISSFLIGIYCVVSLVKRIGSLKSGTEVK
jgi:TRAP-type C4-dicarboxylate transport system permease small subunit